MLEIVLIALRAIYLLCILHRISKDFIRCVYKCFFSLRWCIPCYHVHSVHMRCCTVQCPYYLKSRCTVCTIRPCFLYIVQRSMYGVFAVHFNPFTHSSWIGIIWFAFYDLDFIVSFYLLLNAQETQRVLRNLIVFKEICQCTKLSC